MYYLQQWLTPDNLLRGCIGIVVVFVLLNFGNWLAHLNRRHG